ncbi:MAG: hypothetical protein K1W00_00320 [Lachnospiraceae bacterium]
MKELIEKLSLGITEYTKPKFETDIEKISINMETEQTYTGSFTVVCTNGKPLKGIVFSTDSRLIIENSRFIGRENIINYKVCTDYANKGDEIAGFINVVTNGGEAAIPFTVSVDAISADTSIGSVKNLFQFASLAQTSYDEAVRLFGSPDFPHIFLENDLRLAAIYNGLIGSSDINMAMEEFLVASSKKNKIQISLSDNEKKYADISENYGDTITISKNTWGYTDINIFTDGDFIHTDKRRLTSQDFAGSNYELSYYIKSDRLHKGKNYGAISFVTPYQSLEYKITIDNTAGVTNGGLEEKRAAAGVIEKYIDFRLKKTDINKWAEDSRQIVSRARGIKDSMLLKLFQAHIFICQNMDSDGEWLLENVAEELISRRDEEPVLYCYYLYIRTLQKRDDEFTGEVTGKIRALYEGECSDWRLLWMLIYLDESCDRNLSIKLLRIKDEYNKGMRSPLMYYEALSSFNVMPEMMRVLDDFEVQVLNFGMKNDCISKKLAMQVSEIIRTEKHFKPLVYNVVSWLYEKYQEEDMLQSICALLIKCNMTDHKYFKWFERGVEKELKLTSLYEYYMYAIDDDYDRQLPQIVLLYFAYNHGSLSDTKADMLFANVIKYKENIKTIYDAYRPQIERYAAQSILNERAGIYPAVIYRDVLDKAMVGPELAEKLPVVLNAYEIKVNEKSMQYVIIVHKETKDLKRYKIKKGKAFVSIYTEDAAIIFEDAYGKRYEGIEHELKKFLDMEEYLRLCYEISNDLKPLAMYFADKYLRYRKDQGKSINMLKYMLNMEGLTESYRVMVEKEIIDYYSNNYDGDSLDEYLLNISADNLGTPARIKIMEMSVIRGLYNRAYELMAKYGFYNVEPRRVFKCAARIIEDRTDGRNEPKEDNVLVKMTAFAFEKGKYNEETLGYLGRYYNGTTKELLNIWKAAKDFCCDKRELEEKIIVQMLFTGAYVSRIDEIYASYEQKIPNKKVKKAYLFSKSYDYFVKENIIEESIFDYIEKDIDSGNEINDMCALAYLKYMSEKEELPEGKTSLCRTLLYELTRIGKNFEFFKAFRKYFPLPYSIIDKTIVEYRTEPDNKVLIHYIAEDGDKENGGYITAEMEPVCDGIFTYSFVLFYGENILYYITEEADGSKNVTESRNLSVGDIEFARDTTRYGIINDILVCRDMKEEKTFEEMTKDYLMKKELIDSIFDIKH